VPSALVSSQQLSGDDMTDIKFDALLNMDDPNFAQKLVEAIGLQPGEKLEIATPQFEREDGKSPEKPPSSDENFDNLRKKTKAELLDMGLRLWDESGLMLLPYQWYDKIPEGVVLRCIDGSDEPFRRGVTDDDYRAGVLAYGIIPDYVTEPTT